MIPGVPLNSLYSLSLLSYPFYLTFVYAHNGWCLRWVTSWDKLRPEFPQTLGKFLVFFAFEACSLIPTSTGRRHDFTQVICHMLSLKKILVMRYHVGRNSICLCTPKWQFFVDANDSFDPCLQVVILLPQHYGWVKCAGTHWKCPDQKHRWIYVCAPIVHV